MPIARLIADPQQLETSLDAATRELEENGMQVALARMLDSSGEVLQLALPEADVERLGQVLDRHFAPADLLIAQGEFELPRLFVSDMDSTMIEQECIDELADYAGIKPRIAAITERAMQGELDFEQALRKRVQLLAGLEESAIRRCLEERITLVPGARRLVATLRARGCRTVLVTGGFHHFADPIAAQIGFDLVVANRLEVSDGKLTGALTGPIVDSAVKRATLLGEAEALGEGAFPLATGDGANDVPMLRAASYGVAYRAKPAAKQAANGWIERGDLTSLLKLFGINESEWVAA